MSGERTLITGATSGIGLATALRFARDGGRVAIVARDLGGLAKASEAIREAGGECLALSADISDRAALKQAIAEAVATFGGLDVVVANVGAAAYGPFRETPPEDFDRVVDVSFRANVDTIRETLPHLESSEGALVITGSAAADLPLPLMSAYTAAKHALRGFVDALRIELRAAGSPVEISLVEPGPVDTPFWRNVASVTGRLPPPLPLAYHPDEVALAIRRSVDRRLARVTVGGFMVVVKMVHGAARPLSDRLLARLASFARGAGEPGRGAAAIWDPSGEGELRNGLGARPSVLVRGLTWTDALRRLATSGHQGADGSAHVAEGRRR